MRIKKSSGKIYGADFTAAEQRAFDLEAERQLSAWNLRNGRELASMFLWILHEEFGFGPERLKKFFLTFSRELDALDARYRADEGANDIDSMFLCTLKLKEYGVDLEAWEKEILP